MTPPDPARAARLTAMEAVEAFMHEHWALLGIEAQRFAKPSNLPSLAEVIYQFLSAHVETLEREKAELAAENAQLRQAYLEARKGMCQAEQARDAAHAALRKFGKHEMTCAIALRYLTDFPRPDCTCGLDAALAASAPQKEQQ